MKTYESIFSGGAVVIFCDVLVGLFTTGATTFSPSDFNDSMNDSVSRPLLVNFIALVGPAGFLIYK